MIAEATGGDLFAIKTERNYPGSHKELIDEAKREAEAGEHPRLVTHIENLKDYDVILWGIPTGGMICRWRFIPFSKSMILAERQ